MKRNLHKESLLSQDLLKELFRYEAPHLFWRVRPSNKVDISKQAGCLHSTGYWKIKINHKIYSRSRLVFFMHKGFWPEQVDHLNCIRHDDRIENLVASNALENAKNKKNFGVVPWKYISKVKSKTYQQGFYYLFGLLLACEKRKIKQSSNLEKLVTFRNGYLQRFHPDKLATCNLHDC